MWGAATFLEFPPVTIGKVSVEGFERWGLRGQGGWFFYSGLGVTLPAPQKAFDLGFLGEECVLIT